MAVILNSAIFDSSIFYKRNFTQSFSLNLMMAAILNSAILDSDTAILDSDTFLYSLKFTQKHTLSTLTLTQTNSIWLKLIHSHSTWWWQPSWILANLHSAMLHKTLTQFNPIWLKLIQSDSTWWWQAILNSTILISAFTQKTLTHCILTQLDNGSYLEFCHLGFSHFAQTKIHLFILTQLDDGSSSWILPSLIHPFCYKRNFTQSFWL